MRFRCALLQQVVFFAAVGSSYAAELNQQTLASWNNVVESARLQMNGRLAGKSPFLWVDENPMRSQQLKTGEIVVVPLGKSNPLSIPHGLIHYWIGAVYIPGGTIQDLSAVVSDYGRYSEIYRPTLVKAERLDSIGDEQKFGILWVQKVFFWPRRSTPNWIPTTSR